MMSFRFYKNCSAIHTHTFIYTHTHTPFILLSLRIALPCGNN